MINLIREFINEIKNNKAAFNRKLRIKNVFYWVIICLLAAPLIVVIFNYILSGNIDTQHLWVSSDGALAILGSLSQIQGTTLGIFFTVNLIIIQINIENKAESPILLKKWLKSPLLYFIFFTYITSITCDILFIRFIQESDLAYIDVFLVISFCVFAMLIIFPYTNIIILNILKSSIVDEIRNGIPRHDLSGADLRFTDLSGVNLTNRILRQVDFTGSMLSGSNLAGANLSMSDFNGSNLVEVDLRNSIMINSHVIGSTIVSANLEDANMSGMSLVKSELNKTNMRKTKLINARLQNSYISESDLTGAELISVEIASTKLSIVNLSFGDLGSSQIKDCHIDNVKFVGSNLSNCNFSGSKLTRVNFTNANLSGTNLEGLFLDEMTKATLKNARNLNSAHLDIELRNLLID